MIVQDLYKFRPSESASCGNDAEWEGEMRKFLSTRAFLVPAFLLLCVSWISFDPQPRVPRTPLVVQWTYEQEAFRAFELEWFVAHREFDEAASSISRMPLGTCLAKACRQQVQNVLAIVRTRMNLMRAKELADMLLSSQILTHEQRIDVIGIFNRAQHFQMLAASN